MYKLQDRYYKLKHAQYITHIKIFWKFYKHQLANTNFIVKLLESESIVP